MRWLLVIVLAAGFGVARAEMVPIAPFDDPTTHCFHDTVTDLSFCRYDDPLALTRQQRIPFIASD